jgi:ribokinase
MALQRPRILVVGSITMDLVAVMPRFPERGETVTASSSLTYPGGKGANQAASAARLGADATLIGRVGADPFGGRVLEALVASGVDVAGVTVDQNHPTGMAFIEIEERTGQNRIVAVPGANLALDDTDLKWASDILPSAQALILQLEVNLGITFALARLAHERGCLTVLDPAPAKPIPPDVYRLVDVITPNETEAEALAGFPVTSVESGLRAAHVLHDRGVPVAVVTLGERGVAFATSDGQGHIPPYPVAAVDTVGAGDAFNGALATAMAEGRSLEEALRWGAAAGGLAVTRHGAQEAMPNRGEVEALLTQE